MVDAFARVASGQSRFREGRGDVSGIASGRLGTPAAFLAQPGRSAFDSGIRVCDRRL